MVLDVRTLSDADLPVVARALAQALGPGHATSTAKEPSRVGPG